MSTNPAPAPAPTSAPTPTPKHYASISGKPGDPLPDGFVAAVKKLEAALGAPIWLLIQNGEMNVIDHALYVGFRDARLQIAENRPVALLLESPGGEAGYAYKIARLFQRRASTFTVVVPQWAKSAATLLTLGGSKIVMGRDAELGPLDVQIYDPDKEEYDSALNAVQSLERLNAFALTAMDQVMQLLLLRTRKKSEVLLPMVFHHTTEFLSPLLEKIDTIELTRKSRDLKVAEQYAARLMKNAGYGWSDALRIARALVERFPTHGFAIDRQEAETRETVTPGANEVYGLGLKLSPADPNVDKIIDELMPFMDSLNAIGTLKEAGTP
jgi:hypothetical protein